MRFESELLTARIKGQGKHRLVLPLVWVAADGRRVTVPVGFVTDKTSALPEGDYTRAAVVHDHLYVTQIVKRAAADRYFLEAMTDDKVPAWRRWPIYWGVRLGGQSIWDFLAEEYERHAEQECELE